MEEIVAWASAHGRLPDRHSAAQGERSMAQWLYLRRREAAAGILDPAYSDGLARCPGGWTTPGKRRMKPAGTTGSPSSRTSARKATTGPGTGTPTPTWNTPSAFGSMSSGTNAAAATSIPLRLKLLDDMLPGWQAGRTRGRPPGGDRQGCARWGQSEGLGQMCAARPHSFRLIQGLSESSGHTPARVGLGAPTGRGPHSAA